MAQCKRQFFEEVNFDVRIYESEREAQCVPHTVWAIAILTISWQSLSPIAIENNKLK